MNRLIFRTLLISILGICFLCNCESVFAGNTNTIKGIPPKLAADYINAVIQADRKFYSESIVARLNRTLSLKATENWPEENTLLLPAQFLSRSSKISNLRNIGMKYRLLSLWPINIENSPRSKLEKTALQRIIKNPDEPYTRLTRLAGIWHFQTIYPDIAINESCVSCHNNHSRSPKKDFKAGDVMGGVFIDLRLGKHKPQIEEGKNLLAPEVVSNYVHSILDADRYVYSKYIVDRLQSQKIIQATENWEETNSLPLPAQFLLNAARLIRKKNLGLDFRLISLWPINPHNGPANEFERIGLESVKDHPIRPYTGQTQLGDKSYFQAIYPDLAVAPSCVTCHNAHQNSPKHDFELFKVMGGIVVTLEHGDIPKE